MQRVTMRFPEELLTELDTLVELGWYKDRSAAIRDATRHLIASHEGRAGPAASTFDFETRSAQIRADGGEGCEK